MQLNDEIILDVKKWEVENVNFPNNNTTPSTRVLFFQCIGFNSVWVNISAEFASICSTSMQHPILVDAIKTLRIFLCNC